MLDLIDLGHPVTLVMDFNGFNNFVFLLKDIFIYFYGKIRCLQNWVSTLKKMFIWDLNNPIQSRKK
jgi:hypothetical protein